MTAEQFKNITIPELPTLQSKYIKIKNTVSPIFRLAVDGNLISLKIFYYLFLEA